MLIFQPWNAERLVFRLSSFMWAFHQLTFVTGKSMKDRGQRNKIIFGRMILLPKLA